jgi:phosphoribosyl-AMP cyclohydrolase
VNRTVAGEVLSKEQLLALVRFDRDGLAPAIVQDAVTRDVLMMAWMNAESLQRTLEEGESIFWSRSRQAYWHKGATSGHRQQVTEVRLDCDGDTLLILVEPAGPACHTGAVSCFFRTFHQSSPVEADASSGE